MAKTSGSSTSGGLRQQVEHMRPLLDPHNVMTLQGMLILPEWGLLRDLLHACTCAV